MIPRSRPPTAHLVPRRSGRNASSHDTKNASASRWAIVGRVRDTARAKGLLLEWLDVNPLILSEEEVFLVSSEVKASAAAGGRWSDSTGESRPGVQKYIH